MHTGFCETWEILMDFYLSEETRSRLYWTWDSLGTLVCQIDFSVLEVTLNHFYLQDFGDSDYVTLHVEF